MNTLPGDSNGTEISARARPEQLFGYDLGRRASVSVTLRTSLAFFGRGEAPLPQIQ